MRDPCPTKICPNESLLEIPFHLITSHESRYNRSTTLISYLLTYSTPNSLLITHLTSPCQNFSNLIMILPTTQNGPIFQIIYLNISMWPACNEYIMPKDVTNGLFGYCLLLKTENWKHCSKIIFKYINNVVEPNFKENFVEKSTCGSRKQYTGPTELDANTAEMNFQLYLNSCLICFVIICFVTT